ncbi:MAG: LysM peptidoglycan-binding domain-containing protein [Chloroflexi bacterium]|nr:LysM peptidoglycan-binding domain-containing protein [Chloroflexota bacterium]
MFSFRKISFLFSIFLLITLPLTSVRAQDGGQGKPPDGTSTIHVVQRGENLFRIAQQYGTTVEAIAQANNITDTRFIEVGQRLLIPNVQVDTPGVTTTYVVQPGESLRTIALKYHSTLDSLATLNDITQPTTLYAGQTITVRQGSDGIEPLTDAGLYVVQAGDTIYRLAAKFGVSIGDIAVVNDWSLPTRTLWPGEWVVIPNHPQAGPFVELPDFLSDFHIQTVPVIQGESIGLRFTLRQPMQVTGTFIDRPINLDMDTTDPNTPTLNMGGVIGVHAFTTPGVYPLTLIFTDANGVVSTYQVRVSVLDGGYSQENIDVPDERQDLLDSATVQGELDKVIAVVSGNSPIRYFGDLLALPAPGSVTSAFGTRRTYADSTTLSFHGGADFGGAVGTPIYAPAGGVVVLAEQLNVRGNAVIIDHGWGVYTGYWHMSELFVEVGQAVNKGLPIGALGNTGLSTGAHLHWEMWVGGVQVNPIQWAQQTFP